MRMSRERKCPDGAVKKDIYKEEDWCQDLKKEACVKNTRKKSGLFFHHYRKRNKMINMSTVTFRVPSISTSPHTGKALGTTPTWSPSYSLCWVSCFHCPPLCVSGLVNHCRSSVNAGMKVNKLREKKEPSNYLKISAECCLWPGWKVSGSSTIVHSMLLGEGHAWPV